MEVNRGTMTLLHERMTEGLQQFAAALRATATELDAGADPRTVAAFLREFAGELEGIAG